jgi:hypothetical protein
VCGLIRKFTEQGFTERQSITPFGTVVLQHLMACYAERPTNEIAFRIVLIEATPQLQTSFLQHIACVCRVNYERSHKSGYSQMRARVQPQKRFRDRVIILRVGGQGTQAKLVIFVGSKIAKIDGYRAMARYSSIL